MEQATEWSIFFDILFLKNNLIDGLVLTIGLALSVWFSSLVTGFLFAEIKYALPKEMRFIINFFLWLFKRIPILVLMFYFYYCYYEVYDKFQYLSISSFIAASLAMSFWASGNMTDIFYRCKIYRRNHQTASGKPLSYWIFIPQSVHFLGKVIAVTPIASLIGFQEFFSIIHHYIQLFYNNCSSVLFAAVLVYLLLIGLVTIIAKVLEKILRVPEALFYN